MLLFQQMLVLFTYMAVGYAAAKKHILTEDFGNRVSWLVLNVANPMMVISSAVNGDGSIRGSELLLTAGLAIAVYALLLAVAALVPKLFRLKAEDAGYYRLMTAFNNIGFMGFPVISALYGSGALLYAAVFLLPFNFLFYTYGVNAVSPVKQRFQWKKVLNAGVIASIAAVILYLAQLPVPQYIRSVTLGFSNLTAPMSMIVIGISLAELGLKELFLDFKLLVFAGMKLLLIPIAAMLVIREVVSVPALQGVCMVMLATPSGSMTAMLAQQYGGNYQKVAQGVALTTLLSVITIPLVAAAVL